MISNPENKNNETFTPKKSMKKPPKKGMIILGIETTLYNRLNSVFDILRDLIISDWIASGLSKQYASPTKTREDNKRTLKQI